MKRWPSLLCVSAMVLSTPAPAWSQAQPADDAKATGVLTEALEQIQETDAFTLKATMKQRVASPLSGMDQTMTFAYDLAVDRPDRMSMKRDISPAIENNMAMVDLVLDGTSAHTLIHGNKSYSSADAPDTLDQFQSPILSGDGLGLVVSGLLKPQALIEQLDNSTATWVGQETIEGASFDRVRVTLTAEQLKAMSGEDAGFEMPIDVWVTSDAPHLLRKLVPDMKPMVEAMRERGQLPAEDFDLSMSVTLDGWNTAPALADDAFAFNPPADATKVEDVFAMAPPAGGAAQVDDPKSLVGQAAPDFTLPDLDGKPVTLSELKGQIVVLDFWATWCPPCVDGLPKVAATAEKFADQGVVFYAMNQQETPDVVRAFLKNNNLTLNNLMDDGKAAQSFGVRGIPQTVVIDKQGVIRAVHVGFGPGSEKVLEQDILAALK